MRIGFHVYGTQLPPAAGTAGVAGSHAGADVYRLVRDGIDCDFLLVGGGVAEANSDMGRASQSIVPWAAASLCMAAPQTEIVTKLNAWAFDPAHIARLGANLWELSGRRWSLYLDSDPAFWPEESAGHTPATVAARSQELLDIVFQHWSGRADHAGAHLASTGRMVGPRPGGARPRLWFDATIFSALQAGWTQPDGFVSSHGADRPDGCDGKEIMLTCAVVLGRTVSEAHAIAGEFRSLSKANCLVGDVESVAAQIAEVTGNGGCDRIAIGLPTLRQVECSLFLDRLVPILRAAIGKKRTQS